MRNIKSLFLFILLPLFLVLPAMSSFARSTGPELTDTITFRVNMTYMIANGTFNPATDTMDISGSVNSGASDFLQQAGTSDIYEIRMGLLRGVVYVYRFRIHKADTVVTEQISDATTRLIRIPDSASTVTNFFSNINPATVPMTFICNMYYQIRAGNFFTYSDYLDVAGNFNNNGANDVLFNQQHDSLFKLTLFLDTALIGGTPLKFKFRINGNWATAELQGDSSRTYTLTGVNDSFTAWYDNIDPTVPALPVAYDLSIQDTLNPGKIVIGSYHYEDYNLKPEGESIYRWYISDSIGGPLTAIDSAFQVSYTIDSVYIGKYLVFEVTPVTIDSISGFPVRVYSGVTVSNTGIAENKFPVARIYPNPVTDLLYIQPLTPLRRIELLSLTGQVVRSPQEKNTGRTSLSVVGLSKGIYFLRVEGKNQQVDLFKVIVN